MTHSVSPRNAAGPHRLAPPCPPIVPDHVYPWRRLADWGFGARGVAALVKAGLPVLRFGRLKFFSGQGLIDVLSGATGQHTDAAPNPMAPAREGGR
jgi:hypothetical protein